MEHRLFFSTVAISIALNEVESTLSVNYPFLQDMHIPRICVRVGLPVRHMAAGLHVLNYSSFREQSDNWRGVSRDISERRDHEFANSG